MLRKSKEHIFPKWLIARSGAKSIFAQRDGVRRTHSPNTLTISMCEECNNEIGAKLEDPVSKAFADLENGRGLSDRECELLVRWLWKFEGIEWMSNFFENHKFRYSELYTLKQRVLGAGFGDIRNDLILGISMIEVDELAEDEDYQGLPIGIDTRISPIEMICATGVFCKIAITVSLERFSDEVSPSLSIYKFADRTSRNKRDEKIFFPSTGFLTCGFAVNAMIRTGRTLKRLHEDYVAQEVRRKSVYLPPRSRVELP